jgi:hypothetical protein
MTNKPHKHADAITAWANGATIEVGDGRGFWAVTPRPDWSADLKYRVKPPESEVAYPVTTMSDDELKCCWSLMSGNKIDALRGFAGSVLIHACDTGLVVTREEFDRAVGDRKTRDMAVAKEVVKSLCWVHHSAVESHFDEDYLRPVIARADKKRKTP